MEIIIDMLIVGIATILLIFLGLKGNNYIKKLEKQAKNKQK